MSTDTVTHPVYATDAIRTIDAAHIRQYPGMYIGNTDEAGLSYLLDDLLTAPLPACQFVGVSLHADGSCSVTNDADGMPSDSESTSGRFRLELAFTTRPTFGRHKSGGMVVNALSEWCEVETHHGGWHHRIEFARGEFTRPLEYDGSSDDRIGTVISFKPDPEIFGDTTFDLGRVLYRLCELAFLNAGVLFTFTDDRTGQTDMFHFPDGLAAYVKYLNTGCRTLHEPIVIRHTEGEVRVEVVLQFNAASESVVMGYMNGEFVRYGGTHETGLRRGLTLAFKQFAGELWLFPADVKFKGEDFREGLVAVVSVRHPEPALERSTRSSVHNPELDGIVLRAVRKGIGEYLELHPSVGREVCEHVVRSARVRSARNR
jgi:DNA gyrase subunit B